MDPAAVASLWQEDDGSAASPSGSQTLSTTAVLADSEDGFHDFTSAPTSAKRQVREELAARAALQ